MAVFFKLSCSRGGGFSAQALFVAADLPPFEAFEFSQFFGAVFLIPAAPEERVRGQILIRNFLKSEESPASHLPGCARIHDQIEELRHHSHAMLAGETSAIGDIAARAIAHGVGAIFRERSEQLVENFIFTEEAHSLDSPLAHNWILIVPRIIQEQAMDALVAHTAARQQAD